jgi:hypothetical protein
MEMSLLTENDWERFESMHKSAMAWLRRVCLDREFEHLGKIANQGQLNAWQRARYTELLDLYVPLSKAK